MEQQDAAWREETRKVARAARETIWAHFEPQRARSALTLDGLRCVLEQQELQSLTQLRKYCTALERRVADLEARNQELYRVAPALCASPSDPVRHRIFYVRRADGEDEFFTPDLFEYLGRAASAGGLTPTSAPQRGWLVFRHLCGDGFGKRAAPSDLRGGVCEALGVDPKDVEFFLPDKRVDTDCICVPIIVCDMFQSITPQQVRVFKKVYGMRIESDLESASESESDSDSESTRFE